MDANSKASWALLKMSLGGFTSHPLALHNFYFVKVINALYGHYHRFNV